MVVQHNMQAMNANRMLNITTSAQAKSTEKLSSGYRINRAADDAAGLAISEKMRGQIRGLNKGSSNAQDGISMIQTAEGALTETHSIIQRMRELAVQSANDTNTDDDRTQLQNEIDQLTQEVDRIANTTEFNTKKLLDGSRTGAVTEKAGKANVDSTFSNGTVSAAVTKDGSSKAAFTDVIRVEIKKDFTAGQSTKDTPKISDEMLGKYVGLLTSTTAQNFGDAGSLTSTWTANDSTQESIDKAKTATDTALQTAKDASIKSENAVEKNQKSISDTVDNIMNLAKHVEKNGQSFLADGATKDDVKEKLQNYINALVDNGIAAGAGTSTAITNAKKELDDLISANGTTVIGQAIAATTNDVAAAYTDATGTGQVKTQAAAQATGKTMNDVSTDLKTLLETYAKAIAGVEIQNNANTKKLNGLQEISDTLNDDELIGAIADYAKAKVEYDAKQAAGTADQKKEYKAKMDDAKAALDKLNVAESVLSVSDLFGNSADSKNFSIGAKVDDEGKLTINMKNKSGEDTVITINNADKLKAGDVLTITTQEMVESKPAATGSDAFRLQVGANAGQEVALGINSMKAKDLNLVQEKEGSEGKALDVTTQAGASMAVNAYDMALQKVSTERAKMGAVQNRLEHTIANLDTAAENTQNAESRIRDTDMASEMVDFSKNNILAQAGQSMLAQANQSNQGVLSLLG